jgi:hypothetical protein
MTLNVWTKNSGYSLGTFQERVNLSPSIALPVVNDTGVTYSRISGSLPAGLRIEGNTIVGTPYEVARSTEYSFCIRASKNGDISDRTLKITIEGADAPVFITPAGGLDIGDHHQYYVMDSSYVDYKIEAFDSDTAVGQRLSYFIARGDGELPPGLVLTEDGRIVGVVQPALSIKPEDGSGTYDESYYDSVAFDFAYRPTNGYDSYIFDTVFYDFSLPGARPKKLNRNYEFVVTVTDGDVTPSSTVNITGTVNDGNEVFTTTYVAKRKFKIFVVGDDYFRADNTTWLDGSGLFTADVTYLRQPIWLTSSDLGTYRANNYVTLILDVYDVGQIVYTLDTPNSLPPGMSFDPATSEIYGLIPYQPSITQSYSFTITATRYGDKGDSASSSRTFNIRIIGEVDSVITWKTDPNLGTINANFISTFRIEASTTVPNGVLLFTLESGRLPPGLSLDLDGEIVGKVYQYADAELDRKGLTTFNNDQTLNPTLSGKSTTFDGGITTVDRVYTCTIKARDQFGYSAVTRTFTITVDTPNQIVYSNLRTKPFLSLPQRAIWKDFISNTSVFTPSSVYRPNDPNFGVQEELSMLVYAGIETSLAAKYISAMGLNHKRKRFQFGSVKKAIAVASGTTNEIYEIIYVEMIDPLEPNGLKLASRLERLGLQSKQLTIDNSNAIWQEGFEVHKSIIDGKLVRTPTLDEQAKLDKLAIPSPDSQRPEPIMTIDSTGYQVSNSNAGTYFPNSISNWRERIKNWREDTNDPTSAGLATERNYLPLWMRSIQPGGKQELGFQLAVPLCYCKVGTADDIILNIKYSNFDFKALDYTADRYIIDSVNGYTGDKYLVFRNDRITV